MPANAYHAQAWTVAYLAMAASMLPGVLTVLFSEEPAPRPIAPSKNAAAWLRGALVEPFADFVGRYRWHAVLLLALIGTYRISDVVMGIMANPFYVDMGYTKDEVAAVSKVYGVVMTLVGAFVGGVLALRLGVMRVLMLGALLSAATNLLFAWLASQGHDVTKLMVVISADNLARGIATSAFVAYLSSLTNVNYSATQYALFSSMMLLLPKLVAGYSGVCRRIWLHQLFHQHSLAGRAGAAAGVAGVTGQHAAHPRAGTNPNTTATPADAGTGTAGLPIFTAASASVCRAGTGQG